MPAQGYEVILINLHHKITPTIIEHSNSLYYLHRLHHVSTSSSEVENYISNSLVCY